MNEIDIGVVSQAQDMQTICEALCLAGVLSQHIIVRRLRYIPIWHISILLGA